MKKICVLLAVLCLMLTGCGKTYEYRGRTYREKDLSDGVIQWLEHYNSLTPEEQDQISFMPPELTVPTESTEQSPVETG